jgi:hypothetical protein
MGELGETGNKAEYPFSLFAATDRLKTTHTRRMARHFYLRLPQRYVGDRIAELDGETQT